MRVKWLDINMLYSVFPRLWKGCRGFLQKCT